MNFFNQKFSFEPLKFVFGKKERRVVNLQKVNRYKSEGDCSASYLYNYFGTSMLEYKLTRKDKPSSKSVKQQIIYFLSVMSGGCGLGFAFQ